MADAKPDYAENVKKFARTTNAAAVAGIVKHLGIALHGKDSSLVSATDPAELQRVRDGFMRKKLGLKDSDAVLDASLKEVMAQMAGERNKSRVTVCYLLAERFGKLDIFS